MRWANTGGVRWQAQLPADVEHIGTPAALLIDVVGQNPGHFLCGPGGLDKSAKVRAQPCNPPVPSPPPPVFLPPGPDGGAGESADLAVESIALLLRGKYDETENRLTQARIIQLLKFCLKTYFMFDRTIYEQVRGTPMGSPISGLVAEAVLQRLKSLVCRPNRPKFRAWYVNDNFVLFERDRVMEFKENLNDIFPDI
nr:unnamed protein product [Spirometra erinaceieuropaei]